MHVFRYVLAALGFLLAAATVTMARPVCAGEETAALSFDTDAAALLDRFTQEPDPVDRWLDLIELEGLAQGVSDPETLAENISALAEAPGMPLWLRERVLLSRFQMLRGLGRRAEAADTALNLGLLETGWVIGPFDNEGGGGMEQVFPPEQGFDPSTTMPGKLRSVGWRLVDRRDDPVGFVPFNHLFYPEAKVLGYLLTGVKARQPGNARLCLAFSQQAAVWVNGREVYRFEGKRDPGEDAACVRVSLDRGVNLLLFKVGVEDGPYFGVSARLTGLNSLGLPPGMSLVSDPGLVTAAAARLSPMRQEGKPAVVLPGPASMARAAVDRARDPQQKAAALQRLARVLNLVKDFDRELRTDEKMVAEALELLPDPSVDLLLLQAALSDKPKVRSDALELAYRLDPHNPKVVKLFVPELVTAGTKMRAVSIIKEAVRRHPDSLDLRLLYLDYLGGLTHVSMAYRELKALYQAHPRSRWLIKAMLVATDRMGFDAEHRQVRTAWAGFDDDPENLRVLLQHHLATDNAADAMATVERLMAVEPYNGASVAVKADLLSGMGYAQQARELYHAMLSMRPDTPWDLDRVARFELMGDQVDAALALWKQELAIRPQDPDLKDRIAAIEKKDKYYQTFVEDAAALAATPVPTDEDLTSQVLLDQRVVRMFDNGLSSTFRQLVVRVLNQQGVRQWRYFYEFYHGGRQEATLKRARIMREGEGDISPLQSRAFPLGGSGKMVYDHWVFTVSLDSLKPGDIFEIQLEVNDVGGENLFHQYFGDLATSRGASPTEHFRYILLAPPNRELYYNRPAFCPEPAVSRQAGLTTYTWEGRGLPRVQEEPLMPGAAEVADPLMISTYKDWESFHGWYKSLIKDQFTAGPALKQAVADLTAGMDDPFEKLSALYRFASNEIRYIAIELGIHGFKPYQANDILLRGYGDCKDKATLLIAMLKEVGVTGQMVLVRTRNLGYLEPSPAALNVWNHAIVYVPEYDIYLDGTVRFHEVNTLPWQDQGAQALVLYPEGARLVTIPVKDAQTNSNQTVKTVTVDQALNARLDWTIEQQGLPAGESRMALQDKAQQKTLVEKLVNAALPGSTLKSYEVTGVDFEDDPMVISAQADLKGYVGRQKDRALLPLSISTINYVTSFATLSTRQSPMEMPYPFAAHDLMRFVLDPGLTVLRLPDPVGIETPFGSVTRTCQGGQQAGDPGAAAVCVTDLTVSALRVSPQEYPAFRAFIQQVEQMKNGMLEVGYAQ